MSYLSAFEFPQTGDDIIDVSTQGSVWNLSQTRVVHWTISNGFNGEIWAVPDYVVEKIDQALSVIEQYVVIDFQFGGYFSNPISAGAAGSDLVYSLDDAVLPPNTWAIGFFPTYNNIPIGGSLGWPTQGGDIFLNINSEANYLDSYEPGSAGFFLLLHETFHALGLKHPFDDGGSGRPTLDQIGLGEFDKDWFSVMSYAEDYPLNQLNWDPATPMLLDVLGLQYLYGPNWETNSGDTTYTASYENFFATIWDAGGVDLIDLSQVPEGWRVFLPNDQLSELVPTKAGFAYPTAQGSNEGASDFAPTNFFWLTGGLENVLGSDYDDEIFGNDLNNWLRGESGNDFFEGSLGTDVIDGGQGIDTVIYSGNQSSFTLQFSSSGTTIMDRRPSKDGTDTLVDIESLQFADDSFNIGSRSGVGELSAEDFAAIVELYIAYFNRAPAAKGLLFWAARLEDGVTLPEIAERFFEQAETQRTYEAYLNADGSLKNTEAFVTAVFNNVLGRDPSGPYWINELDTNPNITPAIFILSVLNGVKGADVGYTQSKTDIGVYFSAIKGLSDFDDTVSVMGLYDGTQGSVDSAVAAIDQIYEDALDPINGEFLTPLVNVVDDPFAVV